MTRLALVAFFAATSLTAGATNQASRSANDEMLLATLQQTLAKA